MEKTKAKAFNKRSFTAIMAALSGVGLPITGVANHVYQFDEINTARHAWMAAHNALSVLFLTFAVYHIVINRRAMLNHIKGFKSQNAGASREALIAAAVVFIVLLIAVGHAFIAG